MGSCTGHRLVIIAVVPPCIAILRKFAAKIIFDQSRIQATLAAVEETSTTPGMKCVAVVLHIPNLLVLHVAEESTTIALIMSVVGPICC